MVITVQYDPFTGQLFNSHILFNITINIILLMKCLFGYFVLGLVQAKAHELEKRGGTLIFESTKKRCSRTVPD